MKSKFWFLLIEVNQDIVKYEQWTGNANGKYYAHFILGWENTFMAESVKEKVAISIMSWQM